MWHCLRDLKFSHFDTIPECDGHTHTHTQTHDSDDNIYHASVVLHGKYLSKNIPPVNVASKQK